MSRGRDFLEAERREAIASSERFVVTWFLGHGRYDRTEIGTLDGARSLRDARGRDEYGRTGMIYVLTKRGKVVHVE